MKSFVGWGGGLALQVLLFNFTYLPLMDWYQKGTGNLYQIQHSVVFEQVSDRQYMLLAVS